MSADNWGVCPRCYGEALASKGAQRLQLMEVYGNIPLADFDILRVEADKDVNEEDYRTFREDYEYYPVDDDDRYTALGTTIMASYSGHCQAEGCNCGVDFKHSVPLKGL